MKKLLTGASILKIAKLEKNFVACMDACIEGLGRVLLQHDHVVRYKSHKLKEHEKNMLLMTWNLLQKCMLKKCGGNI